MYVHSSGWHEKSREPSFTEMKASKITALLMELIGQATMAMLTYAVDTTWRVLLKDLGVAPGAALRRAGLPEDLLEHAATRLVPDEFYRLWAGVEAEYGDPLFPIRLCQTMRSESFYPPLFAALCSPNLLVAAQRVSRYKKLIGPMQMEVRDSHAEMSIEFSWPGGPQPPASMILMELLFCLSLARIGTRAAVRPIDLMTTALPVPLAPYEAFLQAPILPGARHMLRFTREDATRPFITSNEMLWASFEPGLRQRLADLETSDSTVERVRAALHESIPSGLTSMEAIANKLALSKRTLQRRIESEGTSFQLLLKDTRAALARHYLENTTLPSSEISFLLGYDEPNSFYRAFRSWTGTTPERVRLAVL